MQFLCLHYIHNDHDDVFTSRFERKKNIKKQRKQKMSSYIKKKKSVDTKVPIMHL